MFKFGIETQTNVHLNLLTIQEGIWQVRRMTCPVYSVHLSSCDHINMSPVCRCECNISQWFVQVVGQWPVSGRRSNKTLWLCPRWGRQRTLWLQVILQCEKRKYLDIQVECENIYFFRKKVKLLQQKNTEKLHSVYVILYLDASNKIWKYCELTSENNLETSKYLIVIFILCVKCTCNAQIGGAYSPGWWGWGYQR